MRPLTTTLVAFGLLVLGAAIVLASQALSRTVRIAQDELRIARPRPDLSPSRARGAGGAPCRAGPGGGDQHGRCRRRFRPVPRRSIQGIGAGAGLDVDIAMLGPALALLVLLPLALVAISAVRSLRIHGVGAPGRAARPSRLATVGQSDNSSPSVAAAVRLTAEPGEGRSFVPTRSMLVSVVLTVSVLVTILVFGSNLCRPSIAIRAGSGGRPTGFWPPTAGTARSINPSSRPG